MNTTSFGHSTVGSTSKEIQAIADNSEHLTSIVGRMVYLDTTVDNDLYRSIGTVTDIQTYNNAFNATYDAVIAKHVNDLPKSDDVRKFSFRIQATFRKTLPQMFGKNIVPRFLHLLQLYQKLNYSLKI